MCVQWVRHLGVSGVILGTPPSNMSLKYYIE